ncbi:MAG: hypothetical protein ACREC5_07330, partial [Thermoplasmata archaeon]
MAEPRRVRGWRTIRQRPGRARSGQVAPVATMLGLLLVTSFIADFALVQLPGEMDDNEFQHSLLVENQLARLQYTVLAQAAHPLAPSTELSPVTLGSVGEPPFAGPSSSVMTPETSSASTTFDYGLARILSNAPNWGLSGCPATGRPSCPNAIYWDNVTGTPRNTYTVTMTGAAPSFLLNFTGNNDTLSVVWSGLSIGSFVYLVLNGSYLHVTLTKTSAGGVGAPHLLIWVYGEHDVLTTSIDSQMAFASVSFLGSMTLPCPQ